MTRAELRRQKRQEEKGKATYNFTADQLRTIHAGWEEKETALRDEWTKKAVDMAFVLMMSLPVMVLKEKYGWGARKRLPEFAEYLSDYYQEFRDSPMDVWEYAEQAQAYTGVGFRLAPPSEVIQAGERQ